MSVFYEFDDVDSFTTGTVGSRATGRSTCRSGPTATGQRQVREAADGGHRRLPPQGAERPPARRRPPDARGAGTRAPVDASFVLGPIGLGYDRSNDKVLIQLEEVGEVTKTVNSSMTTAVTSGSTSAVGRPQHFAITPTEWSNPGGPTVSGAATRSTPMDTPAPA